MKNISMECTSIYFNTKVLYPQIKKILINWPKREQKNMLY